MKIQTQDYGQVAVVELHGDLDSDCTELFQNAITDLIAKHKQGIVLDMTLDSGKDFLGKGEYVCENKDSQVRVFTQSP